MGAGLPAMVVCHSKNLLDDPPLLQASQLPQGLCAMQAVQRSVGECFGAVDQVLITAHPLDGARCGRGRGCAATERHFASGVSRRKGG